MSYRISDALADIEFAYGTPPDGFPIRRWIDETGRKIVGARRWNWLVRPSTTLGSTASQSYILLPTDFGGVLGDDGIQYTAGASGFVKLTTFSDIMRLRAGINASDTFPTYAAVVWGVDANGVPQPRLELFRTPSTTNASLLTLYYRARWVSLVGSDQVYIPIPEFMESVFRQLLIATVQGYDKSDEPGAMSVRVAAVMAGPDWEAACKQDGQAQDSFGPLQHGALSMASMSDEFDVGLWTQVAGPAAP